MTLVDLVGSCRQFVHDGQKNSSMLFLIRTVCDSYLRAIMSRFQGCLNHVVNLILLLIIRLFLSSPVTRSHLDR